MKRVIVAAFLVAVACTPEQPAESPSNADTPETWNAEPSSPPAATTPQPAVQEEPQTSDEGFPDAPPLPLGSEEIRLLVKALPLSIGRIDFERIDNFLQLYAPFAKNKGLLREARKNLRAAQAMQRYPGAIVTFDPPEIFAAQLKKVQDYMGFLGLLEGGVSNTRTAMLEFYSKSESQLNDDERNAVLSQVGRSSTDDSVFIRNVRDLASLKRNVRQVLNVEHGH